MPPAVFASLLLPPEGSKSTSCIKMYSDSLCKSSPNLDDHTWPIYSRVYLPIATGSAVDYPAIPQSCSCLDKHEIFHSQCSKNTQKSEYLSAQALVFPQLRFPQSTLTAAPLKPVFQIHRASQRLSSALSRPLRLLVQKCTS